MKPHIPATLLAIDTTAKSHLALRAIEKCLEQNTYDDVKLLTDNMALKYAVKIPKIEGLAGYSDFCIKHLEKFVETSHVIVCQADGFALDGEKWNEGFLDWDFIGAPFLNSATAMNGGMSLRSRKLLELCSKSNWPDVHPEDAAITIRHRPELEASGIKFAPPEIARLFSYEGRSYNGTEWQSIDSGVAKSFGFHSWLTKLPETASKPKIYVHSMDAGDLIYGTAVIKKLGGGVLFVTPENHFPYPMNSRWSRNGGNPADVDNIKPLLEHQDYIDRVQYTHGHVHSCDYDLNKFRETWGTKNPSFDSIYQLHGKAFGLKLDDAEPWLTVKEPISFPKFPIVVARTPRYRNDDFDWPGLVSKYGDKMLFVGTADEHMNFNGFAAPNKIPHYRTGNMLDLARVIAGAKMVIANQSTPLAIAHGLGKNCLVECWLLNSNCELKRPGAIYSKGKEKIEIPPDWLK